jgi:hypothetical protein
MRIVAEAPQRKAYQSVGRGPILSETPRRTAVTRRYMRATLLLVFLVFVAACGSDPTGDIFTVQGIVRGQVTGPDGMPVSNAWVALDGLYPSDNGQTNPVYDSTQTDAAGRYLGTMAVVNMPDTLITLSIRVWPPVATGLAPAEILDLGLRLTRELAQDTLVMNVQLAP